MADQQPIIVIDDDEAMRRACQAALRRAGYPVETYSDGPTGLKRVEQVGAELIVVDLKMPGMSGMDVIEHARITNPDIVAIVITGFATVSTAVEAMKAGAYDFIPKPFTAEELRVIIARGLERHRLVVKARQLRREKEAQARKFITFVSHQLQSPLGAVQQYLDVLNHQVGKAIPQQHRQWIERCRRKIAEMLQVIGDWLTISKVEGGQLATGRNPVAWQDLVPGILEGFADASEQGGVSLQSELPADLPAVVGDATALRMLLSNLVANGLEYNHPGGCVRITGEARGDEISLSVVDDGDGIAPEDHERVFEEFYRGAGESAAAKSGTGMGLPICKKIAEELGGRITISSRTGEGSSFTVVLPRAPANESPAGCGGGREA